MADFQNSKAVSERNTQKITREIRLNPTDITGAQA